MSSRREVRAIALRQAKDVDRVVGRSGVLASRIYRAAIDAARSNKVHGATIRVKLFDEELVHAAKDELAEIMAFSYLMRMRLAKRRRSQARALVFASPVHSDAKRIADLFELDLGNIKKKFEPIADEAIDISMRDIRDVMNKALADATKEELGTQDSTDNVIEALRDKGISPRSTYYVENLVRTHAAIAYGAAHRVSFSNDPDLWGYEYVTVGDDRVRDSHERMDGMIRKKDDPIWTKWWPPNGWGCRCQTVAIYDDEEKQTPVPKDADPDEGFDFDPGELVE